MREFTCGMAVGLAVSASVAAMCLPKKSNAKKRFGKTLKTMADFVDELGENIRG